MRYRIQIWRRKQRPKTLAGRGKDKRSWRADSYVDSFHVEVRRAAEQRFVNRLHYLLRKDIALADKMNSETDKHKKKELASKAWS